MQGSRARSALSGTRFGDLRWVDETASTNDDVLGLARGGAPEGVVEVADHQTAGRGRLDRSWHAPPGSSLLVSILLRPDLTADDAHLVTTAVACAAAEACNEIDSVDARIKWPNDLLLVDRSGAAIGKVAGVLAETVVEHGMLTAVVVGIGVNVNWPEVPDELAGIAVALNHVTGHDLDREDLLVAFLLRLDAWCAALDQAPGRARLLARYRELCHTIGAEVRVEQPEGVVTGVARDVTPSGHLLVQSGDRLHEVIAGDVVQLRRA
jgi:BirA family biotin operon repressor/biotin-[acetyl-CoA-carboxylase] ligase